MRLCRAQKGKAADGTLAIMVGGEPGVLERARPVLAKLGTEIFHTGALGSGHATKALNNYLGADHTEIYKYLEALGRTRKAAARRPPAPARRRPRR